MEKQQGKEGRKENNKKEVKNLKVERIIRKVEENKIILRWREERKT
jgi:hypothetical protein